MQGTYEQKFNSSALYNVGSREQKKHTEYDLS